MAVTLLSGISCDGRQGQPGAGVVMLCLLYEIFTGKA